MQEGYRIHVKREYKSGNKEYTEQYELSLKGINCIINTSDYVRMEQKKRNSLDEIAKQIKYLSNK